VLSVKSECLDRAIFFGERRFRAAVSSYVGAMDEVGVERKGADRRERRRLARARRVPVREGESKLIRNVRTGLRAGVLRAGKSSRNAINRVLGHYSKVGNPPVFDPASFEWTRAMRTEA